VVEKSIVLGLIGLDIYKRYITIKMYMRGMLAAHGFSREIHRLRRHGIAHIKSSRYLSCMSNGVEIKQKIRKKNVIEYGPPPDASTFPAYEAKDFFHFEIVHQSKKSKARVGRIHTPHGIIDTPGFVAVGTNAALKGVDQAQANAAGLQLMFANSYHLLLQPGPETIAHAGGLHKFMGRDRPLITDSGGFQVFSLAYGSVHEELNMKSSTQRGKYRNQQSVIKISEDGVVFKSYRDGRKIILTPESSVQAQKAYGADIIIPFDELPPYHITREKLVQIFVELHLYI